MWEISSPNIYITKQKTQIIHLIYIHEKINIINYYVIPLVRNGI